MTRALLLAILFWGFGVEADAQTVKTACQALTLLPELQALTAQVAQLTGGSGGEFITIPRATYHRLLAEARELALLQLELEPMTQQLHHTADFLESNLIH